MTMDDFTGYRYKVYNHILSNSTIDKFETIQSKAQINTRWFMSDVK